MTDELQEDFFSVVAKVLCLEAFNCVCFLKHLHLAEKSRFSASTHVWRIQLIKPKAVYKPAVQVLFDSLTAHLFNNIDLKCILSHN